ncbi:SusC/RagA family TonB-linked outer membrane protein [Mucilaginibacter sp.]|uniref:SusC/RagA family TonB-linked outer membrane protein n=1 Tax=Mucilaginibacter sp. TaxID=1882438 RepID=UPI003B001E4D
MIKYLLPFCRKLSAGSKAGAIILISILTVFSAEAKVKSNQSLNTRITLNLKNKAVKEVFLKISRDYRINFAYSPNTVPSEKKIDLQVKDKPLENVLHEILDPIGMDYAVSDNIIVIDKKVKHETQQDQPVRGQVTDSKGAPLPGVSVMIKGTTSGATTDGNGRYSLIMPNGNNTLVFTYIGFTTQEVAVNSQTVINIKLAETTNALNEVVVTALGINREKKSLGYAVSEVKGAEFTQARENNVANALTGKVAGVNAIGLSTGPGGSSRVVIRGNGSLTGQNQPLYVVNGMPIDNSTPGGSATVNGLTNNVDRGDGIGGINPDDIETMTVLKGGTAAALYGSRAANGVILITTKKGRAQKGIGIEYNTTATLEDIAVFPKFQYQYGQGDSGVLPTDLGTAQSTGRRSWGESIDPSKTFTAVDGQKHSYVAQKDNLKNFYQTGTTFTNTLAFTGGSEALTYRVSAADLNSRGLLPGTTFDRKTGNVSLNGKLGSKITIEALAQYNLEKGHNKTSAGDALGNPNWLPYMVANTVDVRWIKPGYDASGTETVWNDAAIASNGYFVINKYKEDDTKNRMITQGSVAYEPVKNLVFKGVVSRDFYSYNYSNVLPTGTLYVPNGSYSGIKSDASETNGLATVNYHTRFADKFNISVLGGVNAQKSEVNQLSLNGSTFTIPYFYSYTNLATASTVPYTGRSAINSVFGSADFDYKSLLYLTVTGRKDWFSVLSQAHNSVFYPSVGGSFILSDALKLPAVFNLAKIRASYARVGGGGPDPYQINLSYSNVPSSGPTLQNVTSSIISNPNLKPYTSTTREAGIEMQMFKNRLNFDVTLYDRETTNDIVNSTISSTSGYNSVVLNLGAISNKGIELQINGTPLSGKNFSWNPSFNFSFNKNRVLKLAENITSVQLANSVNNWAYINNIVGYSAGQIVGTSMQKDAGGNVVYSKTTGYPVATDLHVLGNSVAPYTMGLTNSFRYKRFNLSVLLDGKFGNKIFSVAEVYEARLGLLKSTLPGRDNGLVLSGVDQTGAAYSRTVPVSGLRSYYDNYKTYSDLFLHDGGFVKLRQVIFGYNIPVSALKLVKLQSANISFVARNLAILYKKTENFDPESSLTNSNIQGIESIGLPHTRSFGLNLSVKF